jgi:hypothetical protein
VATVWPDGRKTAAHREASIRASEGFSGASHVKASAKSNAGKVMPASAKLFLIQTTKSRGSSFRRMRRSKPAGVTGSAPCLLSHPKSVDAGGFFPVRRCRKIQEA